MPEQRSITLSIDAVRQMEIAEEVGNDKLWKAIGYLSSWNMSFPSVTVADAGDNDLVAVYRREDGSRGYVISAVWHEDHYGFHS
jgi:hypothetical protein